MSLIQRAKNFRKQYSLGQNFLVNEEILNQIIKVSNLSKEDIVIEVGPGIGFLTEKIIAKAQELYSIELDRNTIPHLKILKAANANFHYLRDDFLALSIEDIFHLNSYEQKKKQLLENNDIEDLEIEDTEMISDREREKSISLFNQLLEQNKKIKIVANIPYQISSKILLHLLGEIGEDSINKQYISEINILVQKEFADKLCAKPGDKDFGSLTLLMNYHADISQEIDVSRNDFMPAPKVDSCFIKIKIKEKPDFIIEKPKQLRRLIKAIYANRRKKLINGLKAAGFHETEIKNLALADNLRGETLSLKEINDLVMKL
jgi:16S rRNA (adenine1518-N6/adenine1519-N6)-dimethyltransferase